MAEQLPVIPKAERLSVHTGNIVNWNRLKRKLTQAPAEELSESITSTMTNWLQKADRTALQYEEDIECQDDKFAEKLPENERDDLKVTVKVFLNETGPEQLKQAVNKACTVLGTDNIDTVVVSLPEHCHHDDIHRVWTGLETLVDEGRVFSTGIADLDKPQLEELYDWAQVKPCINQVNLESCCVMPADLVEYAKDKDIQLLTHSDPRELLTEKGLQELLYNTLSTRDSEGWSPVCVVRYSVLVTCRGIIKAKGYVLQAARDTKHRK